MNAPRPLVVAISAVLLLSFSGSAFSQLSNPDGFVYVPIVPCRIVDTRNIGGPFAAKETRTYAANGAATQGGGVCTVYYGITPTALSLNVTVDSTSLGDPLQYGFLSLTPTPSGGSSWMNFFGGQITANAGVASINQADGSFAIKSQAPTNLIVDVYGYFLPSVTKMGSGGPGSIQSGPLAAASGANSIAIGPTANASGPTSTAIGSGTQAGGIGSTALGSATSALGDYSTALGNFTTASGMYSTAMGFGSGAGGAHSTAMGYLTVASGDYSTAMGANAWSNSFSHSFIYSDNSNSTVTENTANNQFMVRASGGFVFYTSTDTTTGATLPNGSGSWSALSDRNAKDSVRQVDTREVLERVVSIPLNTWRYKTQDSKYRHMGPMAQDFYAAFHLGESDTGIDTVDADGVALAAIQGLNAKVEDKDRRIASLEIELNTQRARIAWLESLAGDLAQIRSELAALKRKQHEQANDMQTVAGTTVDRSPP